MNEKTQMINQTLHCNPPLYENVPRENNFEKNFVANDIRWAISSAKDLRFAQGCYAEIRRPLLCFKIETRRHISFNTLQRLNNILATNVKDMTCVCGS